MDVPLVYQIILTIISIGLIIASLEDLKSWSAFSNAGILSWKVGKLSFKWSKLLNCVLNDAMFKRILHLKLASSCSLLILAIFNVVSPVLLCLILLCHASIALRSAYGIDGAYQMYSMILLALLIGSIAGIGSQLSKVCLWFIAGELILSYFIAGWVKLISPIWKKAYALPLIFSTRSYGHHGVYKWVYKKNYLSLFLCWAVLILETFFVFVLLLPTPYAILLCMIGFSFHLFNALFMGLNSFLFSFLAAYPALLYLVLN